MIAAMMILSSGWTATLFAIAIVLFLISTFKKPTKYPIDLTALGLAVFVFVYFWNALART